MKQIQMMKILLLKIQKVRMNLKIMMKMIIIQAKNMMMKIYWIMIQMFINYLKKFDKIFYYIKNNVKILLKKVVGSNG